MGGEAYHDMVDHPWLDETDPKGRKRTRGEKETIVMGLMYNGPQPRTIEDEQWRREDKKQRMADVFNTIVTQHELIRGQWDGHIPETPIVVHEEPNRFGRREEDKRGDTRSHYVRPLFAPTDHFAVYREALRAEALRKERKAREDFEERQAREDLEEEWFQRAQ